MILIVITFCKKNFYILFLFLDFSIFTRVIICESPSLSLSLSILSHLFIRSFFLSFSLSIFLSFFLASSLFSFVLLFHTLILYVLQLYYPHFLHVCIPYNVRVLLLIFYIPYLLQNFLSYI